MFMDGKPHARDSPRGQTFNQDQVSGDAATD